MDYTRLVSLPNQKLRTRSKRVGIITDATMQLIEDMQNATLSWEDSRNHEIGVALAAVQIGVMQRVVIVRSNFEDKSDRTFQVFINPTITKYEGTVSEDFEGCLSIKDVYGKVPRYNKVRIKALNIYGREVRITAEGFLARVLQHEIDHTNGIVYIDHIKENPQAFYTLNSEGSLEKLDYGKKIAGSRILW